LPAELKVQNAQAKQCSMVYSENFNAFLLNEGATFAAVMLLIKDREIISQCNDGRIIEIFNLEHKQ
jgi:hypothetical protein